MYNTTNALVLREVRYKETDRILTLLTEKEGKITVKARGAYRKNSKISAATQQLTYSEMTLFGNRGRWTVNEASVKEAFSGLRTDMELLSLGSYFAECVDAFSMEDQPEPELMQLVLNSLYALSRKLYKPEHIKAAFELRLMCVCGYTPELSICSGCGCEDPEEPVLAIDSGAVYCRTCSYGTGDAATLCNSSLAALRYICSAPAKQLFSFAVDDSALKRLSGATERYLIRHAERSFYTLDYWKNIRSI